MSTNDSPVSDSDSQYSDVTGAGVKLPEPEQREGESGTAGPRLTNKLKLTDLIAFFEFIRECPQ